MERQGTPEHVSLAPRLLDSNGSRPASSSWRECGKMSRTALRPGFPGVTCAQAGEDEATKDQ